MGTSHAVRSNEVQWNGVMPMVKHSGVLDLVTAVTEQGAFFVPVGMKIKEIKSRVRAACGTAAGVAGLYGVAAAANYATQSHATTDAAGTIKTWTITTEDVPAGEVLYFTGDGGATSTGSVDVTVVLVPANG